MQPPFSLNFQQVDDNFDMAIMDSSQESSDSRLARPKMFLPISLPLKEVMAMVETIEGRGRRW